MNNIDEIVSKQTNNKTFDKNAWKEKKAKERNEAYELIEQTSKEIVIFVIKYWGNEHLC